MKQVMDYLWEQVQRREKSAINTLGYVGESCVNEARKIDSYKDITGNLRSSIGYVLVKDGRIIQMSSFEQVKDGRQGATDGKQFARQLCAEFPHGIALVVVAGMSYASYVAAKGKDVLDSSESMAKKLVPQLMRQLGFILK